jgi:drug/metabolite transporter (DMT)-like permease
MPSDLWIVFALLSAFFHAARLSVTKHLSLDYSAQALTLYVNLASLVVTVPLIVWNHHFPVQDPRYLTAVLVGGLVSGLGAWSLNHAIKHSEVSIVGPVMTLTPAFVVLIEWVITRDLPGGLGLLGLALLIAGSYVLSLGDRGEGWYPPLHRLITNPGSRFTLVAAACFGLATTLGRVAIQQSDPLSFAVMVAMINPVILFTLFSLQDRHFYRQFSAARILPHWRGLLLLGLLFALMRLFDQIALSMTLASYVMGVKRTAGIFSVVLGHFLLREHHLPSKLAGSLIMLVGVLAVMQD